MAPDLRPLLQTGARSEPDLDSNGDLTWDPNGIQSGSHLGPKWDPIRVPFGTRNGIPSGSHLGSHTGPNWAPFGEPLRGQPGGLNPPQGTDQCLLHSSRIVGGSFDLRCPGSGSLEFTTFLSPGSFRIVRKCPDGPGRIQKPSPFGSRREPKWAPLWIPKGAQMGPHLGPK